MRKFVGVALLDMDGTLLARRSIDVFCEAFNLEDELKKINERSLKIPAYKVTESIARLLSGRGRREMEKIFSKIPLAPGAGDFVNYLKERGFKVAIATDSFQFLGEALAKRLGVSKVYGNLLEFKGGVVTGKVLTERRCMKIQGCREFAVCKLWFLNKLRRSTGGIAVCVGDGESDLCAFAGADIAIAYRPKIEKLKGRASAIVSNFNDAAKFLERSLKG